MRQALAARGADPEMEYAAALVSLGHTSDGPAEQHLRRAVDGAGDGSLLAATIAAHRHLWDGRAEALRAAPAEPGNTTPGVTRPEGAAYSIFRPIPRPCA